LVYKFGELGWVHEEQSGASAVVPFLEKVEVLPQAVEIAPSAGREVHVAGVHRIEILNGGLVSLPGFLAVGFSGVGNQVFSLGVVHSRPHFFRLSHFLGVHLFETGVGRVVLGRGNHVRFGLGRQHGSCFVIAHHHVGVLNVFVHGHEERVRGYQRFELGVGR